MSFIKCESCDGKIKDDKCVFAVTRRAINDKEYVFCCPHCADEFERKREKNRH